MRGLRGKAATYRPRREASEECNPTDTSLASSLQGGVEINFCCLRPPVCGAR